MDYRFLGETGVRVSALSLGTMTFGGSGSAFFESVGGTTQDDAQRMVDVAIDHGINLVDTADVYSRGISETMLGKAIRGKRDRVFIATKCHGKMSDDINNVGQSRHNIIKSCEASLRRLGVDHIDLLQVHGFDAYVSFEESLSALTDLVRQGKVRYLGCSNLSAWQVMKALGVAERHHLQRYTSIQANYSLAAREAEQELLPLAEDQRLGFLVWSPLAGGVLSGKYHGASASPAVGRRNALGDPGTVCEVTLARTLDAMKEIALAHDATLAQVALNYLLAKKNVTSVIVGAKTSRQLEDNLACSRWTLAPEELLMLDEASARPLPYPHWHQRKYNGARYVRP
jgi:aryl-alcohol dehydrogenase-like predicted oxidoreductase